MAVKVDNLIRSLTGVQYPLALAVLEEKAVTTMVAVAEVLAGMLVLAVRVAHQMDAMELTALEAAEAEEVRQELFQQAHVMEIYKPDMAALVVAA